MRKEFLALFLTGTVFALSQDTPTDSFLIARNRVATPSFQRDSSGPTGDADLADALNMAKNGRYAGASTRLFHLSYSPRFINRRMQIKYVLGLTLQKMNLPQLAAFQFMSVVKEGT